MRDDRMHSESRSRAWGPAQWLALASIPLLAYEFWTYAGWIIDGPHSLNQYRDATSFSYWAAKFIEVGLGGLGIVLLVKLIRDCKKEGRLTFDTMLVIGFAFTIFYDTTCNFFAPIWLYSSNWVNLNDWWGYAPLIQNPVAGTTPFPVLFLGVLYPVGVTCAAIVVSWPMAWAKRHWPDISTAKLIGVSMLATIPVWTLIDGILMITHLWAGPGMPWAIRFSGDTFHWSMLEWGFCVVMGGFIGCLRFFKFTERGTEHMRPRRRALITTLATTAACILIFTVLQIPHLLAQFTFNYSYPKYPAHLVNATCDAPGWSGTEYGPCPGSDGFCVPLRSTQ